MTDDLLVSQTSVRIERYRREADGSWRVRVLDAGAAITLANGAVLPVDAIYAAAFDLDAA